MKKITQIAALAGVSALVLSGCAANEASVEETSSAAATTETTVTLAGTLNGSGASSQGSAMEAWIAAFQIANPDVTINYDPTGSGTGRAQFQEGATLFTGSDSYWKEEELAGAFPSCVAGTQPWEFPVYISPIAVIFNLDGIASLNMEPATVAGIFAGEITNWNDASLAAANPGVSLPDLAITAVHRSDESGTSKNFTDYLAAVAGDVWTAGAIEAWPTEFGGEGAQGTSGVISAVSGGNGTIGYADASRAGSLGTVAVKVGADFVAYSPEAAAAVLDASGVVEGRAATDIAIKVARDTDASGAYPIVLVSYLMGCNEYADKSSVDLVKGWASYLVSEEGQSAAAEAAGAAPISASLREKAQAIIDGIK